jgi:LPS O-antigen subunit length determinant protein (WzzB/FepE family)
MNNTEIRNEDEISLLDLFTVLLRYWKLIASITLAFIILAAVGYIIYPAYQYKEALDDIKTQGIMQVEIVQKAQAYVSQKLDSFILRPDVIYNSLYAAGMKEFSYNSGKVSLDTDENKNTIMYLINLFWIQNLDLDGEIFAKKEIQKTFSVKRTEAVVEVTFKDKDAEMIKKFMESIFNMCTISVEENMRTNAKTMVSNYERLLNLEKKSESVQMMLEKDFDTYVYLKDFLDGKEIAVKLVSEPVLVEAPVSLTLFKKQYLKIGIIIVFAGIFLAVMLAFVLNAVRNIKNDEEAMKKIRDALESSGSK